MSFTTASLEIQPLFEVGIDVVIANPFAALLAEAGIFGVLGTTIGTDECCHDGSVLELPQRGNED
jgi:hypothetical protein